MTRAQPQCGGGVVADAGTPTFRMTPRGRTRRARPDVVAAAWPERPRLCREGGRGGRGRSGRPSIPDDAEREDEGGRGRSGALASPATPREKISRVAPASRRGGRGDRAQPWCPRRRREGGRGQRGPGVAAGTERSLRMQRGEWDEVVDAKRGGGGGGLDRIAIRVTERRRFVAGRV